MMNEDRKQYEQYVQKINKMLQSEDFYASFQKKLKVAKPSVVLSEKHRKKNFDLDWIRIIEDTLPNIDNIVRNPRKHIVTEEDIVDISLARAISTESVKHLAQHTNMIASVDKEGNVTPNRILNITKEESYEIYENRFIYTLIKNLNQFVTKRMDAIKKAYVNDHILELDVDTSVFTGKTRVFYKLELIASLPYDELAQKNNEDLSVVERIAKMQRIIAEFLGGPFSKQMVNSAPVRPPITRTNVILKNPNFKKALVLWQFIESYDKTGFSVENEMKKLALDQVIAQNVNDMVYLSSLLMHGLIDGNIEDSLFFKESNIDEKDLVSQEQQEETIQDDEVAPVESQVEEEIQENTPEPQEPEEQQTKEDTEQPAGDSDNDSDSDSDNDDEDDTDIAMPVLECRSVFQRNKDEKTLSKAEILRINKALDRIIVREKSSNNEQNINQIKKMAKQENVDKEALATKLEREKLLLEKTLERKAKLAEKERLANEKLLKEEQERLQQLQKQLDKTLAQVELENQSTNNIDTNNLNNDNPSTDNTNIDNTNIDNTSIDSNSIDNTSIDKTSTDTKNND